MLKGEFTGKHLLRSPLPGGDRPAPASLLIVCAALGTAVLLTIMPGIPAADTVGSSPDLLLELGQYRHKIVYESNRAGNWDLFVANADGSNPVNLTNTPALDELFPRVSPDGTRICFVADQEREGSRVRDLYYMNIDGTGRVKIAESAREPCWSPDNSQIAYMKGEGKGFPYSNFATKGLFIYDLKTGATHQHVHRGLEHLANLNWSPDGRWFVATVMGGLGFSHSNVAIEAQGDRVIDLELPGCRPHVRRDGQKIAWSSSNLSLGVADLDFSSFEPLACNRYNLLESPDPFEVYHVNWSPDGKYVAFSRGPKHTGKQLSDKLPLYSGAEAPGWNVCIADATQKNRWVNITGDGKSCKMPNWVLVEP